MTDIQIISDIHTESHRDAGESFIKSLPVTAPILVIAGDIGNMDTIPLTLKRFTDKWEHVVFVTGNHDYGRIPLRHLPNGDWERQPGPWTTVEYAGGKDGRNGLHRLLSKAIEIHPNLHWLNNDTTTVEGIKFVGGTLWFPDDPMNVNYTQLMWDFHEVPQLRSWVYEEARKCVEALHAHVTEGCVVVTHHLPSWKSIAPQHRTGGLSHLNRFFIHDQTNLILDRSPQLWIHGHTHSSADYHLNYTRIVCNPFGPLLPNRNFNDALTIEVEP